MTSALPVVPALAYVLRAPEDVDAIRNDLKETGVCVVKMYEEDDPVAVAHEEGMSALAAALRVDCGTPHGARGMGGIVKPYAAACHPAAMRVRLDPGVRDVFAGVYGIPVADAMVSWDAVGILGLDAARATRVWRATEDPEKRFKASTGSTLDPHVDIGRGSRGAAMEAKMRDIHPAFHACIQAQFVCRSVPRGGATLVVSPGPWYAAAGEDGYFDTTDGKDFCRITAAGHRHLEGTWRAVEAPRGCLIMWISSLPHANKLADVGVDPRRLVVFVAWQSRRLVANAHEREALARKKKRMIFTGGTTDHWSTHIPKIHRGNHFSNGDRTTTVLYTEEDPPVYDAALMRQIDAAL